jgi:hypothetical protein
VAVAAQKDDVLEPVVGAVTVHVVELRVERLSAPFGDSALLAPVLLQTFGKQAKLEVMAACPTTDDKQVFDRRCAGSRHHVAALLCLMPTSEVEAELLRTLANRQTGVVDPLYFVPVVSTGESPIWIDTDPSDMERDLARFEPKSLGILGSNQDYGYQKPACCQLHQSPSVRFNDNGPD